MKRITRTVPPADLGPLLEQPPRATLAVTTEAGVNAFPVAFRWDAGCFLVGIPTGIAPPAGRVKLLVDDGPWYFDLRGVWVRGGLSPIPSPGDRGGERWFELMPEKTAAWHYGRMRYV
jgi:hypothetical protein